MRISYITLKPKPTQQLTRRSALYVLSLLSLRPSSGRKRRFFMAGVLTTVGAFGSLSPHIPHIQIRGNYGTSRPSLVSTAHPGAEQFIETGRNLYALGAASLGTLIYLLRKKFSHHTPLLVPSLYVPYSQNIRGSP